MDSDLACVIVRAVDRADAMLTLSSERSIISEAVYHFTILMFVLLSQNHLPDGRQLTEMFGVQLWIQLHSRFQCATNKK